MTVVVSFVTPKGIGSVHAPGIGRCRVRENITIPGSTTATVAEGEVVLIGNAETDMVAAAFGTTPDAAATAETAATSAGVPCPSGQVTPIAAPVGAKINVKALA